MMMIPIRPLEAAEVGPPHRPHHRPQLLARKNAHHLLGGPGGQYNRWKKRGCDFFQRLSSLTKCCRLFLGFYLRRADL